MGKLKAVVIGFVVLMTAGCSSPAQTPAKEPCQAQFDACVEQFEAENKACLKSGESEKDCAEFFQLGKMECHETRNKCLGGS